MRYNLLNLAAFDELSNIIRRLQVMHDNYAYFSTASVNIIIDLTITVLNCTADVIISDGKFIGVGDYACRKGVRYSISHDISRSELLDFIMIVESIRRKIEYDNHDLIQD